ncbi:ABC transporter permease [Mycoplasma crocodyli]|uniref:ABC transporter, permease protein n=1 Tax=Mycoplasma crocodyli (strain ATCC 51981 / MP145) TaxID=512564 RepID=D5E534_MYCCM|nr:ABC transporter permease [Mycoplasma crocodyli]ADE19797.1 ABC transporter, permease protein [Mycoplasma crocodyli MP145]
MKVNVKRIYSLKGTLYYLTKRNFKNFFKDTKKLFFTILTPFIFLIFFGLFLGKITENNFETSFSNLSQIPTLFKKLEWKQVHTFTISFLLMGLLSVTAVSNAVSLSSVMVSDRQNDLLNDFFISPVKSSLVKFSYIFFNIIVNVLLSWLVMLTIVFYVLVRGLLFKELFIAYLKIFFLTIINCAVHSVIFVFIFSFVKNNGVYNALASILGTFIGVFVGAYFPINQFPKWLQAIVSLIPATQMNAIFRNEVYPVLLKEFYSNDIMSKIPQWFEEFIDLKAILFTKRVEWYYSLTYIVSFGIIFATLSAAIKLNLQRRK